MKQFHHPSVADAKMSNCLLLMSSVTLQLPSPVQPSTCNSTGHSSGCPRVWLRHGPPAVNGDASGRSRCASSQGGGRGSNKCERRRLHPSGRCKRRMTGWEWRDRADGEEALEDERLGGWQREGCEVRRGSRSERPRGCERRRRLGF